jgi:hypothetical protein
MMRKMTAISDWGINLEPAICEVCDWRYLVPQGQLPTPCPHCFQTTLEPLEAKSTNSADTHPPELVIPFGITPQQLGHQIQQFAGSIWFAPADLTAQNLQSRLQPVYLPMWLVDSQVRAQWQAEVGFDYEAVSHRDSYNDKQGGWSSQQVTEMRIRWESRVGRLVREYHNIPAPALEEHFALSKQLGQFNFDHSQPYRADAVDRAMIRLPNRLPNDAWPDAVPAYQSAATEECRQAAGADHIREFRWAANYQNQNWTLLLLPLYTTYYLDDDNAPQPILIHGQSGQLSGPKRASMRRAQHVALIIVGVAALIFVLSLIVAVISLLMPPIFFVAGIGIVLAIIVGMLAIVPLVIAWQINRVKTNP